MAGFFDFLRNGGRGLVGTGSYMTGETANGMRTGEIMQPRTGLFSDPAAMAAMASQLLGQQGNMANLGNAFGAYSQVRAQTQKEQKALAEQNKTYKFFQQQAPEIAALIDGGMPVPQAWEIYTKQRYAEKPKGTDDMQEFLYAQGNPEFAQYLTDQKKASEGPTTGQQDYEYAINQLRERGVPEDKLPTFQEYSKPKSRGISFRGADGTEIQIGGDDDGSYGGTSLPAEVGGRIGLGDNFIKNDYPKIIEMIKRGEATGSIDYGAGVLGRGNSGIVQRRMASGADALRRGLTGAGMGMAEAEDYARRYLPQPTDDAPTLQRKAEGLKADLEAVSSGAIKGKAGDVGGFMPNSGARRKYNPDTGRIE